ncbi:phosphoglycolate phosphatase [Haloferula helveola]|uniref:phosphoglycolate phosphatase n=1 Tax=Haloferula helveola TaxID=490095 RepID=A0ABM7RFI6_9BACT|nr:phosphoglycolate phosphatase [Haloferula helveola]
MQPSLIFDLDGTLVDSLPGIAESLNRALAEADLPSHPHPAVRDFIGNGSYQLARRAVPEDAPDSLALTVEMDFKRHYATGWKNGTLLYPGIPELIEELAARDFRMAVLSNKPDAFTREIVRHFFPSDPFDLVVGQRDGSARKPDPAAVVPLFETWRIGPEGVRFIGDSTVDRATAEAAGIPFIGVAWGYHDPSDLGDRVARNAPELGRWLMTNATDHE